ncbi:MAG: amidohydrolase family protein, partial [Chloroflexi bacterium]|nr:amidohydrolase family protein [Chloroflexota bacterium]
CLRRARQGTLRRHRLMWGSDWPVCLTAASYEQVLDAANEAIGPLSESDRAGLLGGNARAFYRL